MTTSINSLGRDAACAAASALITFVLTLTFVESTSVVPGSHSEGWHVALQPQHAWIGQPQPAVLVD